MIRVWTKLAFWAGIALTAIAISTMLPASVHGAQGDVGGRPANPIQGNPRTNDIFIYTLDHKDSVRDGALIVNNTDEQKVVSVYPTDGITSNTGALTCKQAVEARVDVGSWIKLETEEITVKPRSSQKVNFSVTVPDSVDVGEHNGCIVYQVKDDKPITSGNIKIHTRSATRVAVTIPGALDKNVEIRSFETSNAVNSQRYTLNLENTGNVSADTQIDMTLTGIFGGEFYKNQGKYPVLPKNKLVISYQNDSLPIWGGWYWVNAKISYDKRPNKFGFEDQASIIEKPAERMLVFVVPHVKVLLGGFAVILLLVCAIFYVLYRRREKKDALRNWPVHTVKMNETIQSIAEKQDIGWKKLAHLNGIKAPYTLKPGDKIRIPKKMPESVRKKLKIQ